jgi:hypothetical protein
MRIGTMKGLLSLLHFSGLPARFRAGFSNLFLSFYVYAGELSLYFSEATQMYTVENAEGRVAQVFPKSYRRGTLFCFVSFNLPARFYVITLRLHLTERGSMCFMAKVQPGVA